MPGIKPLAVPADVIYTYDGSFDGFLCCVFESVYAGEVPVDILREEDSPLTLMEVCPVVTDLTKAERVRASIPLKISARALELVTTVFCSCLAQKELRLLEFLLRGYREGGKLCFRLGDAVMAPLLSAEKHLLGEAHLLKGFVRFADVGGALAAVITPKNYILPFIARHFVLRYHNEQFMIFDKTNKAALVYQNGKAEILRIDHVTVPEISEREARYQALWKQFYNTIAIEGRENPRCRMTHMPKRYWENMLEVSDLVHPAAD
ncbi:probable DNA metabolism protein [Sporobacter termitidis DSM 10068]|uniref:Probable DNA metabolism protein n=1 Tax=Sporobacter termitidis DSM 10068 TaxID=1123282 RepID=A0A1M5ZFL1_9FIRM|nr:TIGR03915 family putative DNA repair protein [Sporobacter termitidis]SHI22979.1 probable DNA metabolism protein [Sporobacter termitidis DSM 10068]